MDEETLKRLFGIPDGPPSPRPRFSSARPSEPLNLSEAKFDDGANCSSFERELKMDDLGFTLLLVRQPDTHPAELWALAQEGDSSLLGKEVRIGLIGSGDAIRRVVLKFTDQDKKTGACYGQARIGVIEDIRTQLGDQIDYSVFLLK